MKRNLTIKTEVFREQFNQDFLYKFNNGDLAAADEYWAETASDMIDNALIKLRKEFANHEDTVVLTGEKND